MFGDCGQHVGLALTQQTRGADKVQHLLARKLLHAFGCLEAVRHSIRHESVAYIVRNLGSPGG